MKLLNSNKKIAYLVSIILIIIVGFSLSMINIETPRDGDQIEYPDFFTSNSDYYVTRIASVLEINEETYSLTISGLVENNASFSLQDLRELEMVEIPLTIECIGNSPNGRKISTAMWKGFVLYDLLNSLGINENATGVRYLAADGYYASHTMDQVRDNGIIGAIYMNDVPIPPLHGFPLRILNPGYYGVKQPAWVINVEVIDSPLEDFWEDRGWDTSPPMEVDSMIFFPREYVSIEQGENLEIGGAAFGGTRISRVEYTIDDGNTWMNATITQRIDYDNVWVFWGVSIMFNETKSVQFKVRAIDIYDNIQKENDSAIYDGSNEWPVIDINVA